MCLHTNKLIVNVDGKNNQGEWVGGEIEYCHECLLIIKGIEVATKLGLEKDRKYIK